MESVSRKLVFIKLTVICAAVALAVFGFWNYSEKYQKVSASAFGPSPSHTGAPDEADCTACHSDFVVNSGTGSVNITGVPPVYTPGQQYQIQVTTSQADAVTYGFQLTAVDSLGRPAGSYTIPNQTPAQMQTAFGIVGMIQRQYIHHTSDGIVPQQFGSKTWTFLWTAPAQRIGRIGFYAAGNAANSDGSTSGDNIYKTSRFSVSGSTPADFDGDGKTDISIFRPGPGEWWYLRSSNSTNYAAQFGLNSDKMMAADFTGDGKNDIAFFRPSNGNWFVLRSEDSSFYSFPFGASGDIPQVGDFDGDGKADNAVFRPSTATWFIRKSSDGSAIIQSFGANGDVPVVSDYDGDGISDIAIFRPSLGQWWLQRSQAGTIAFQFGMGTDKPTPGDFTGDGKADTAFWRPSTGEWFVLRSENQSFYSFPFGTNGDIPVEGDYDGDRKFDAGVFRPSTATWYVNRSSGTTLIQNFGVSTDVPVPGSQIP